MSQKKTERPRVIGVDALTFVRGGVPITRPVDKSTPTL
jgi:hypothetical protein